MAILIAMALTMGATDHVTAQCDLVEINHCHDAHGNPNFIQLIAWDWSHEYGRHDAQAWVMICQWDREKSGVVATSNSGTRFYVRCKYFRETWTKHDPEVENRKLFAEKYRRKVW